MRLADAARDGADTASSQPMLRSIRSWKMPYRKFDLSIGKLSPIFNDGQVTTLCRLIDDLAGLATCRVYRQPDCLWMVHTSDSFRQIPRANQHLELL